MNVLFVCTGNLCRSPVAERLTMAWADRLLDRSATEVTIVSAGLHAVAGRPMHPNSAAALVALGGDPTGFASRPLLPGMVEVADLVLTMTRRQRRDVLHANPRALRRTFTVPEAAGLLGRADPAEMTGVPLPERARALATRLDAARAVRRSAETDDVCDPIRERARVHHEVCTLIARELWPLAAVLFDAPLAPR